MRPTLAQLVLLEFAAAAVVGGIALDHVSTGAGSGPGYRFAGIGVAVVLVVLGFARLERRWLYQLAQSWVGLTRRRRRLSPGLSAVLGEYRVESVPGGRNGTSIGVVRCSGPDGPSWCVPLWLGLDDVLNEDAPVPAAALSRLLVVEDVPLASVRLVTVTTPARALARQGRPAADLQAARYVLLSLDGRRAAAAIAGRGGSAAAVEQILRRCAITAEEVFGTAGVRVRRLEEPAVAALFGSWLGPATPGTGRRAGQSAETWSQLRTAGTWSTTFAVTGNGPGVLERVQRVASAAPTPVAVTALVVQPARSASGHRATLLLRVSAADAEPPRDALGALDAAAREHRLVLQRAGGEQAPLLRATLPVGVGEAGVAAAGASGASGASAASAAMRGGAAAALGADAATDPEREVARIGGAT